MDSIRFDFNNMMASSIGEREGITEADIKKISGKILAAHKQVMDNKGLGWQGWTKLPYIEKADITEIIDYGKSVRKNCDNFVVLGIGGSALGPLCVANALLHLRHNELPRSKRKAPKLYVEDNVDPERMQALLDVIDLKKSYFNVITKSGETSETLSQFLILYSKLKEIFGKDAKERIIVTTTIGKGTLYDIAKKEGFKIYGIDKGVGGRFSVLSPVGLVPFAVLGIDIKKLVKGALDMSKASFVKDAYKNPALMSAVMQYISMKNGKSISVLMPYADSLKYMADFYCQLWGESLGKAKDNDGNEVFCGQTPAKSLGVTDQHSQIQLYTEGPFDKVVTILGVENFRKTVEISKMSGIESTAFLQGHTMNELINCELTATEFALTKANRASFRITLNEVNAYNVGALLQYFMYETAFAGALLNIDAYNQPGVEEGKLATFAMLGRKGYEAKLAEIKSSPKDTKYIM